MVTETGRIRITAEESNLAIQIDDESGAVSIDMVSVTPAEGGVLPVELRNLLPTKRQDEYVLSFDFETAEIPDTGITELRRLDVHVRDVTLRLRHAGYMLEGVLTGWVGYTNAHPVPG